MFLVTSGAVKYRALFLNNVTEHSFLFRYKASLFTVMRLYAKFSETRCLCCTTRRDVIEMTGETLSVIADGSTLGHIKPVAYGTIKVHKMENREIRKIARDVQTILSTSPDRMAQRSLLVSGCYHGSLGCGKIHTESGECENAMFRPRT